MNWEAIGVLAEVIGAVAVVATLLFLAIEVRNNKNATESASIDSLAEGFNTINAHIINESGMAEIYSKGVADPESLDEIQKVRFMALMQCYVNHFATVKKYHDAGQLSKEEWTAHSSGTSHVLNSTGGRWARRFITVTPSVAAVFESHRDQKGKDGHFAA